MQIFANEKIVIVGIKNISPRWAETIKPRRSHKRLLHRDWQWRPLANVS